jgi:hypothetical protein
MNKRIIYPNDFDGVSIIVPADCGLTIEEIAEKDVPPIVVYGPDMEIISSTPRPYQIVELEDIPSDRTFRDAWEYVE